MMRLLGSAAAVALFAGMAQADYVLHVLHTNDLHNRIESISGSDSTCAAEAESAGKCFGGVARVATKVREMREQIGQEGGNIILLDAGDQFQGSLFYTTYKGADTAEFMTAIGYDVMGVGNHEFDDGPEGLAGLIDAVEFPIVSSNLDVSQSNLLAGKIEKNVVLEVGGEKIGIISALAMDTPETASPGDSVIFMDDADSLRAQVEALTDEGVNKIISLNHVGYKRDQEFAAEVAGIDAVIGGHSHTYLGEMEAAQGPYPTLVEGPDGNTVPVYQAGAYSRYLGHAILTFDDDGNLIKAEGAPILLDASVTPDPDLTARIAEMAEPIAELRTKVVAETAAPIDGDRENCRQRECEMGNLVADAMLDRVSDQGMQIALTNSGGLRASISEGPVTMGEIYDVIPFQNTLATFQLPGSAVLSALENGVSQYDEIAGRFPAVAGLKFTADTQAPVGSRISDVEVFEDGEWVPIDPDKVYGVVSNNYTRRGGDGYAMFASEATDAYDFGPDLAEVLADYVAKQGADFAPKLDGRIVVK